jgi:hypothetical protein
VNVLLCEHVVSQPRYNHNTQPTSRIAIAMYYALNMKGGREGPNVGVADTNP